MKASEKKAYHMGYQHAVAAACTLLKGIVVYRSSIWGRSEERVLNDSQINQFRKTLEGVMPKQEIFYFVREPDHMIECSENLPNTSNIDVIKMRHRIFKTYEEAKQWQNIKGIKSLEESQELNREFSRNGLDEFYGYK